MSNEDLEVHLRAIGYDVACLTGDDGHPYIVIRNYRIPNGSLAGTSCDVAVQRTASVPYVAPPAIHTLPALIEMGNHNTQASGIGPGWQYWSRVLRGVPTPTAFVAHLATIFSEV